MTSKEIIADTLLFNFPERLGRSFNGSDITSAWYEVKTQDSPWSLKEDGAWYRTDTWGNLWKRIDTSSKGEVIRGVLESTNDIKRYIFPDFSNPNDYDSIRIKRSQLKDKWFLGLLPGFTLKIASELFRLDHYLIHLMLATEDIHILHDRIDLILEEMIFNYASAGVDAVFFWEDWGTQQQLLINPDLWKEEFYPRFTRLCGIAHACGIKVFMHSCGRMTSIIQGLINAGIDVLQFDQPSLHGIDILASYQDESKITFWCPVDIQKTLQTKNELIIRAEAEELLDNLWRGRGGFIAGYYGDNKSIGLEPEWQQYACDEFIKKGRRERYEK